MHTFFYLVDFLCDVVTLANWNLRINEIYWFACCVLVRLFWHMYAIYRMANRSWYIYMWLFIEIVIFLNGHFSWVKSCFCFVVAFLAQNDKHCICSHFKCLVQTYCFVYKTYYLFTKTKTKNQFQFSSVPPKLCMSRVHWSQLPVVLFTRHASYILALAKTIVCNCWMIMRRSFCLWHNKCRLFCEANVQ